MKNLLTKNLAKISLVALGILIVSIGLLFVPYFYKLNTFQFNGYEFIFHFSAYGEYLIHDKAQNAQASGAGITALVFMLIALVSFIFSKKSSALSLLGGISITMSGIFFLVMQGWAVIDYKLPAGDTNQILFIAYVIGALQFLVGVIAIAGSIFKIKEEKVEISKSTYSYLKNKK